MRPTAALTREGAHRTTEFPVTLCSIGIEGGNVAQPQLIVVQTVEASDAAFRILISPTPLVGPDIPDKYDSHANEAFVTEGRELREFLVAHDMIVICGDRHWQYVSIHEETGLREHATGAASDAHAGGWTQGDVRPEHRYVNVIGGFLSVTADRREGTPTLALRNHGVDGEVLFEDILAAE